jgi:RHS repeat-associated protein
VFVTDTAYDSYYGRPKQLTYQSGESIWLRYSKYGHATREASWPGQADYRQVLSVNNRGQSLSEKLGAQITASYGYTAATGQMVSAVYTTPSITIRQLAYQYDVFGNVLQQSLAGGGTTENYAYDQLQRLTQATRAGGASGAVSYAYDAAGNFTSKSDFSSTASNAYTYTGGACGGGPNAVKSVAIAATLGGGTRNYCYDANGNLTGYSMSGGTAGSFFAKYDHDNLPYYTSRTAQFTTRSASITYDADGARVRQSGTDGTRLYDGAYEKVLSPSIEEKVYVGDYAVLTKPSGGTTRVNYLLKDRLGSVDTVTDASGAIAEQRGYDAFGKPRQGSWADLVPPRLPNIANTPRGFTQHEHLNSVELIHMNGRAYDYNLGRFLSVDPIIQFPTNSQSLNPYSYIMNNPLSAIDPTGFSESCIEGTSGGCKEELTVEKIEQTKRAPLGSHIQSEITNTVTFSNGMTATQTNDGAFAHELTISGGDNGATGLTSLGSSRTDGKDAGNQSINSNSESQSFDAGEQLDPPGHLSPLDQNLYYMGKAAYQGDTQGAFSSMWDYLFESWKEAFSTPQNTGLTILTLVPGVGAEARATKAIVAAEVKPVVTDFIAGAKVTSRGRVVAEGVVDVRPTLERIRTGTPHPHVNDGAIFQNREGLLPAKPNGYYREYVHPTPGVNGAGPQRIVVGAEGELYYTPDHYATFIPLNPGG